MIAKRPARAEGLKWNCPLHRAAEPPSTSLQVAVEESQRVAELDTWINQPLQHADIGAIMTVYGAGQIKDPRPFFDLGVLVPPPLRIDNKGLPYWSAAMCKRLLLAQDSEE